MEALLRDGLSRVCIHPVGTMQPLAKLTLVHKNPAVQPISLCKNHYYISRSLGAEAILSSVQILRTSFTNICRIKTKFPSGLSEILWLYVRNDVDCFSVISEMGLEIQEKMTTAITL